MTNSFLKALYQYDTYTENGAVSHSTTGSALLNYFAKSGTFRRRKLEETFADLGELWAESPKITLQIIFYNRLITRQIKGQHATELVQSGQGSKSEFRNALVWLARYQPEALKKNLALIPYVGTWKDLWHQDVLDELPRKDVYDLIELALMEEYQQPLIAKYLPRIRSKANTFNERHQKLNSFAYGLIKHLGWTPAEYRKFKASGKSHEFQRKMCANQWNEIPYKEIPGRALNQLAVKPGKDGKTAFQRHGIEDDYVKWLQKQPTAKFTGYVYELLKGVSRNMSLAQKVTLDKQFDGLIALAKRDKTITENVWCALDTSGSMTAPVADTSAFNICLSLGIYFSTLNQGAFKDHVIMFDSKSQIKKLSGSFSDKVLQLLSATTAWGSTNFESVIDEIVRVRNKNPEIPVKDFPTTLIVVSDMQFNPVGANAETNYESAMRKLRQAGLPKMRIVWWWVTSRGQDFPSQMNDQGVIMIGGFDGSIVSQLLGESPRTARSTTGEKTSVPVTATPVDAMLKVLNQEILQQIRI